jgi:hypothetical protein
MLNKVRPKRSEHLTRPDSADGPSRELGEAKDRNYREDGSQSPDKDRTEDCSPDSDAHVEGEVRQHCAHDVASRAVDSNGTGFKRTCFVYCCPVFGQRKLRMDSPIATADL